MDFSKLIELIAVKGFKYEIKQKMLEVSIPQARKIIPIYIDSRSCDYLIQYAPQIFEYNFIEGFGAIWSSNLDIVECEIDLPSSKLPTSMAFSDSFNGKQLKIDICLEGVEVEISSVSYELMLLTLLMEDKRRAKVLQRDLERLHPRKNYHLSIKIKGLNLQRHEQALTAIKNIVGSVCFQLESQTGNAFTPVIRIINSNLKIKRIENSLKLNKITQQYNSEALSLYWYAVSAHEKPLLQFLAFYQVVEFFYPIYTAQSSQKKIANLLKSPTFNHNKPQDISKLFNLMNAVNNSRSELSQLEATLNECIDINNFKAFLSSNSELKQYLESKNADKLSKRKIKSIDDSELIKQLFERFYDIRCRIVHAKGDQIDSNLLHPQSSEIEYLHHDIEIAKYIAQQVLIASSEQLTI
ncbi:hypothetical protein [Acinetobacter indicus]|uniref:hypothetical protein n=1 Tax=Acinetobacter indicus TaxID=756892 RepID=UPI000CEC7B9F|nr:hypothetical protein [Acinetobacter indicus]